MEKHYTCLLCQQQGEHLVTPGYLPNLFALQEHLVREHSVPWEDVLLSSAQPGASDQGEEVTEWSLPREKAAACGLQQERYLRVVSRFQTHTTPFYVVATFPSHESCQQAEMEIIDACKRRYPISLAGGAGELEGLPMVVFIDLLPDHEPDHSLKRDLWSAIHWQQGTCTAIPAELVDSVADTLRDQIRTLRQVNPGANWAEVDYRSGTVSYDLPTI